MKMGSASFSVAWKQCLLKLVNVRQVCRLDHGLIHSLFCFSTKVLILGSFQKLIHQFSKGHANETTRAFSPPYYNSRNYSMRNGMGDCLHCILRVYLYQLTGKKNSKNIEVNTSKMLKSSHLSATHSCWRCPPFESVVST